MNTKQHSSTPIVEFVSNEQPISTVNVELSMRGDDVSIGFKVVPSTRVGRSLPDWPEALSLSGGSQPDRRN